MYSVGSVKQMLARQIRYKYLYRYEKQTEIPVFKNELLYACDGHLIISFLFCQKLLKKVEQNPLKQTTCLYRDLLWGRNRKAIRVGF